MSAPSFSSAGLPPLTKAQAHYWRDLCGELSLAGTAGLPTAEAFPPDLCPNQATLKAMVAYGILARRHRAWHLTRPWYARLTALRLKAVDTPPLRPCERPAPGLPSYAELQAWEVICRWLDTQPKAHASLPFVGLAAFTAKEDAEALAALGETLEGQELPAGLLRGMRKAHLVRHTSACEWVLAKAWRERLLALWQGYDRLKRELPAVVAAIVAQPHSLVAGIDTWVLNWRVEEALAPRLRKDLDDYQTQAREAESELETRWLYDGIPLQMYRWGRPARCS
jgi:hypothetical protein